MKKNVFSLIDIKNNILRIKKFLKKNYVTFFKEVPLLLCFIITALLNTLLLRIITVGNFTYLKPLFADLGMLCIFSSFALLLYKPVSNFIINSTPIDDNLKQAIEERLSSPDISDEETDNIVAAYYDNVKNSSTAATAKIISETIINVGCMIIVFIVSKLILLLFRFSGDLIAKLPLIKQLNSVGGFVYGILEGFILVYILLALIAIMSPVFNMNQIINMINSSIIANIMYNNNIIFIVFT